MHNFLHDLLSDKKGGEIFVPEKINPDLVKLAFAVVKSCKLNFKFHLKSTSLNNALKAGKREQMLAIMQKCFLNNKNIYESDYKIKRILDTLKGDFYKDINPGEFMPIFDSIVNRNDEYFLLEDFMP